MEEPPPPTSPTWSTNTKLLVAATTLIIVGAMVVRFWHIITPLFVALIIAYLLHPLASFLRDRLRFNWVAAVSAIYAITGAALIITLTVGGVELAPQVQSFINLLQTTLDQLPEIIQRLSQTQIHIGRFVFNAGNLPLGDLSSQLVTTLRGMLGQTGTIISAIAGGAISTVGTLFFIVFVSYFLLAESGGIGAQIINFNIPGYEDDIRRMGISLNHIWKRFLRGQVIIFFITFFAYFILLTVLGVRYSLGLALIAGLARFLPYVGPLINWILLGLVTYFQDFKLFGLSALAYTALVIGLAILLDQIMDNAVAPRLMSRALRVHPAAVLVAVIVAADLLGLFGVVIAAPILATVQLLATYIVLKLLDRDPFPPEESPKPERSIPARLRLFRQRVRELSQGKSRSKNDGAEHQDPG